MPSRHKNASKNSNMTHDACSNNKCAQSAGCHPRNDSSLAPANATDKRTHRRHVTHTRTNPSHDDTTDKRTHRSRNTDERTHILREGDGLLAEGRHLGSEKVSDVQTSTVGYRCICGDKTPVLPGVECPIKTGEI